MPKTKGELVLKALRKAGLYSEATFTDAVPQEVEDSLHDLEDMMAQWKVKGIDLGYLFADSEAGKHPLSDDDSGLPSWANDAVSLKLAVNLCMDHVTPPSNGLLIAANAAYQSVCIALTKVPSLQRRNDMPTGAGNSKAFSWDRFYVEKSNAIK